MTLIEIGKQIGERRRSLHLRQEDVAEMSGVTARTIYSIEEGTGNPSYNTLNKLCGTLGFELQIEIKKVS